MDGTRLPRSGMLAGIALAFVWALAPGRGLTAPEAFAASPSPTPAPSVARTAGPAPSPTPVASPAPPSSAALKTVPSRPSPSPAPPATSTFGKARGPVRAEPVEPVDPPYRLEARGSLSFGSATVPTATVSGPTLLLWGLELLPTIRAWQSPSRNLSVYGGLGFEYRFAGQYSDVNTTIGNFRGSELFYLSPAITAVYEHKYYGDLRVRWAGKYSLSLPTVTGGSVSYGSPFGLSATAAYSLAELFNARGLWAGVRLETLRFGSRTVTPAGTASASDSVSILQFGGELIYAF